MSAGLWPPVRAGIQAAPDHPALQAIERALQPVRPLLRDLTYEAGEVPVVTLCFGAEAHLAGLHVFGDTLQIDLPVGDVPHRAGSLHALLEANLRPAWRFRIDSLSGPPHALQALAVIEQRFPLADVEQLPDWLLDGWRQKVLSEGLLHFLNGAQT